MAGREVYGCCMPGFARSRPEAGESKLVYKMGLSFPLALCLGIETLAFPGTNLPACGATCQQPYRAQPLTGSAAQQTITVWATVLDKHGEVVDKLKQEDFLIFDDGREQAIASFASGVRRPLSIGILLQWSGLRSAALPSGEIDPAIRFFGSIMQKDDFSFAAKFTETVDTLSDFTTDPSAIQRALRAAAASPPRGLSALYDSLIWACNEKLSTRPQRRILLVVTDGHDNASRKSQPDAVGSALRSQTAIYVVSLAYASSAITTALPTDRLATWRQGRLECVWVAKELADQTGGDAIFVRRQDDLPPAFGEIERELRNQYSLGYSPVDQAGHRGFHRIKIEVKGKGLRVLAPKGRYTDQ